MKLANLWFFFGQPAVNAGSAEFTFDADAVGTVVAPVVVNTDDSRGWRYHAHARVEQVRARGQVRGVAVAGSTTAQATRVRAAAHVANAGAQAAGRAQAAPTRGRASVRAVQVAASSGHLQAPARGWGRVGQVAGTAGTAATVRAMTARGRAGSVEVFIGPDLVDQELEEIMFLLEVA